MTWVLVQVSSSNAAPVPGGDPFPNRDRAELYDQLVYLGSERGREGTPSDKPDALPRFLL